MRGTFFSADFVKDRFGNLRLLELNTDTNSIPNLIPDIDFSGFINILVANSITTVHVIHKSSLTGMLINALSASIAENAPIVDSFIEHKESLNTIYPTQVPDDENSFILRFAYDEAAVFDSVYAKDRFELYKLFIDGGEEEKVAECFYSSSTNYVNTLNNVIQPGVIPDAVMKDKLEFHNPVNFYKVGKTSDSETDTERWNNFISQSATDGTVIEQFHYNTGSLVDNSLTTIRNFSIIYGDNLDLIDVYTYKMKSIFDLPISIDDEIVDNEYVNKLHDKHYFEYVSNHFKASNNGFLGNEKILMSDSTYKTLDDIEVGDVITSYYISGSPDESPDIEWNGWEHNGADLPIGSYITSSMVMLKNSNILEYGSLFEIVVDSDSILCSSGKIYLIYDTSSDSTKFKATHELNPETDYFYDITGSIIDIDEVNFYVTSDVNANIVELDVEDTDTYIISGSTSINSIITHNSPCFVAGTKIQTDEGAMDIEDIQVGHKVLTYNHLDNSNEYQDVLQILSKKNQETVHIFFENGKALNCTHDHPIFSLESGYVSYKQELSKKLYNMNVGKLEVGLKILMDDGKYSKVTKIELGENSTVYNLHNVNLNHNFFANGFLVHNRCFIEGTKISMMIGTKKIEDVEIGDMVMSFNEKSKKQEYKKVIDINTSKKEDLVKYTFGGDIEVTCTTDHPIYVNDYMLASVDNDLTNSHHNLPTDVQKIRVGDVVHTSWEEIEGIKNIEKLPTKETQTYIITVEDNHNFYANGILVHNK